jgi:hypothetical protein
MKRISLTAWIFIGMAAGVALGILAPGFRQTARAGEHGVSAPDPLHHRAAAVRHAGGRHRRRRRHQAHGAHRRQGHPLFRNRHHASRCSWGWRGQPGAPGRRRPDRAHRRRSRRTAARRPSASVWSTFSRPASSTPWRATTCCRWWSSPSCSAPPARPSAPRRAGGRVLRVAGRGHVPLHRYVMYLAPLGVGAALAVTVGSKGVGVLFGLGKLILTMYASLAVRGAGAGRGGDRAHSAGRVLPRRARAVPDRLLHGLERSRAAAGAREHGAVRRAQAHRGLRDSHRLQLQPGRHHAVSLAWPRCSWRRPPACT